MTESFADLVRDKWTVLTAQHGFAVVSEDTHQVVLDGAALRIVAVHDPRREEFSAEVHPHGRERWQGWTYAGMVGRASLPRLLELALHEMHADPMVLRGDREYYDALAERAQADAEQWTAYYSGTGPRPGQPHLP